MTETNAATDILGLQMAALTATRACPCFGREGRLEIVWCSTCAAAKGVGRDHDKNCTTPGCNGTGRVYVLDPPTPEHPRGEHELRVECVVYKTDVPEPISCPDCDNRGWTRSDDFWAWLDALEDLNSDETLVKIDSLMYNVLAYQERKLAFYAALNEAVQALVAQEGE